MKLRLASKLLRVTRLPGQDDFFFVRPAREGSRRKAAARMCRHIRTAERRTMLETRALLGEDPIRVKERPR